MIGQRSGRRPSSLSLTPAAGRAERAVRALAPPPVSSPMSHPPMPTRPVDPAEVAALVLHYLASTPGLERSAATFRR